MDIPGWTPARRLVSSAVFPGAARRVTREQVERGLARGEELIEGTTSRGERIALVHRPPSGSPVAPVNGARRYTLFLYGNAMTLPDTAPLRAVLGHGGAGVLCVDYPGYGLSDGEPSEAGCYRAAHAALSLLEERFGVRPQAVDVVGWSLGSAVALHVASRRPIRRLVLLSPFAGVASYLLDPIRLGRVRGAATPLRRLGPFAGARRTGAVTCPTLLVSGADDRVTPTAMAQDLAAGIAGPHELVIVPKTGHNDLFARAEVWRRVRAFLDPAAA